MIEINLLPHIEKTGARRIGGLNIDTRYFIYLIPLLAAVLLSIHIILAGVAAVKGAQFNSVNARHKELQSERKELDSLNKDYYAYMSNAKTMQELDRRRMNWSGKLDRLSVNLPSGAWFNEIFISRDTFTLKASVISLENEEMNIIDRFINNLKGDKAFMEGLGNLELGSVQKQLVAGYDIISFILTAKSGKR
ncbi:MAG: hypothetical protein WC301_04090 [Candidatus Omnitrophota bacterium]|jgi:Tfp pilus assembly protein PilN